MFSMEELMAIQSGAVDIATALANEVVPEVVMHGCCVGPVVQKNCDPGLRLDRILSELNSKRSLFSDEKAVRFDCFRGKPRLTLAEAEARLLKVYLNWDSNNGGDGVLRSWNSRKPFKCATAKELRIPKARKSVGKGKTGYQKGETLVGYTDEVSGELILSGYQPRSKATPMPEEHTYGKVWEHFDTFSVWEDWDGFHMEASQVNAIIEDGTKSWVPFYGPKTEVVMTLKSGMTAKAPEWDIHNRPSGVKTGASGIVAEELRFADDANWLDRYMSNLPLGNHVQRVMDTRSEYQEADDEIHLTRFALDTCLLSLYSRCGWEDNQ